ncbi:MAG: WD40-repeat-containing domain protein [Benniella sp.]|nr:MAG: WD40-repeat-containing domain protein [Benniella sp.]
MCQLTMAVSHVLDAMADIEVAGLDREKLHEPLSRYLRGLQESKDSYIVYQAAYIYQALLCIPDNETAWQAAMRRTGRVIQDVSGLVSAEKGLDLIKFMEGLEDIQKGCKGISVIVDTATAYKDVSSLMESGQTFMERLKRGLSFERKRDWYSALRGADALIRGGELATFRRLVCDAPCRLDAAFQWGVCQRLGEIAANPSWDLDTRGSAIAFLGEIYRNDEEWGQQASIKLWILDILEKLSSLPENEMQVNALLDLKTDGDAKKQDLYQVAIATGPMPYPLKVASPTPTSSILLDRAQESRRRILTEDHVVWSCAYSSNGELFAVGLEGGQISIYRTSNWERVRTLNGHTENVYGIAFSPTSNLIASASRDGTVRIWDAETGSMRRIMKGHTGVLYGIAYSPRGNQVASCSQDSTVRIWDGDTGSCLQTLSGHSGAAHSVAYSPHEKQIASGGKDNTVRLWDVDTGECMRVLQGHVDWIRGVAYSPQGDRIVSASDDKRVRVWDVDTGECLFILVGYNVWRVTFSPGSYVACGGNDSTVKLWDIESGYCRTLTGHSEGVNSVVYSPSGDQIASGSDDRTVRIWDIPSVDTE